MPTRDLRALPKKLATAFNNGQGPLSSTTSHSPVSRVGNAPDRFDGNFFQLPHLRSLSDNLPAVEDSYQHERESRFHYGSKGRTGILHHRALPGQRRKGGWGFA